MFPDRLDARISSIIVQKNQTSLTSLHLALTRAGCDHETQTRSVNHQLHSLHKHLSQTPYNHTKPPKSCQLKSAGEVNVCLSAGDGDKAWEALTRRFIRSVPWGSGGVSTGSTRSLSACRSLMRFTTDFVFRGPCLGPAVIIAGSRGLQTRFSNAGIRQRPSNNSFRPVG